MERNGDWSAGDKLFGCRFQAILSCQSVKQMLIVESLLLAFFQFTRYLNPLRMRAGAHLAVVVNSLIVTPMLSSKANQSQFLSLESTFKSYPYVGEMIQICRQNESRRTEM